MKTLRTLAAMLAMAAFCGGAQAGAVVGATEPTQILNNVQLVMGYTEQAQQTATQLQQYATMLRNLQKMTPSSLLDAAASQLWMDQNMVQAFRDIRTVYNQGQQAAYTLSSINQQFKNSHPGFGNAINFANAYKNWSDSTLSAAKNAIKLVTTHADGFASEEGMINELAYKAQTADGQMQAVQAGSAISLQLVGQMQKLRQLQMAQLQSQNEFAAAAQSEKDATQFGVERAFGGVSSTSIKGR